MLEIPGQSALSAFRLAKYLDSLKKIDTGVSGLHARFTYFVNVDGSLSDDQAGKLDGLLLAHHSVAEFPPAAQVLFAVPRAGTISPWSSKATDIAHACGLKNVARIERGIAYAISGTRVFEADELTRLAAALFDRMTEVVLFDSHGANMLFAEHNPAALTIVPLLP